jgi:hypothetical protein
MDTASSGGGKRKAALIAPKSALKKKDKAKKKQKGAKSVASMVVKDMKRMLEDDEATSSGEGEEDAEVSLFKLVRSESAKDRKKRRVNFIVTLAGEEKSYVPQRWSAMMVTDKGEGEKFIPQRPGGSRDKEASTGDKRDRSVSNEALLVDKGDSSPAEEAIAVDISEESKPRQKRKRTKKPKVGKSEVIELQNEKVVSAPDWVGSVTSDRDRAVSTSLSCDSAGVTPVHSAAASTRSPGRPTWEL